MLPVPPERMPGERPLETHAELESALDELIANSTQTVRIFDKALGRSFNTPERYDLLRNLLLSGRAHRVYIALHDTSNVVRDCPRLISLLRQFSHALFIHKTLPAARRVYDPFVLGDNIRLVHRFHYGAARGVASIGDVAAVRLLLRRFDEIWQETTPAVSATTIGL